MSLWAEYHKETDGSICIERFFGFIRYEIEGNLCKIHDLFVKENFRREGCAWALADEVSVIAKKSSCTHLWSRVGCGTLGATEALSANLAYGFKIAMAEGGFIIMLKELENG
jgi:GNAT superfamily N-acetyltransferase